MVTGVYIHIPFCRTRCPYCDFAREPIPGAIPDVYIAALEKEMAAFEGPDAAQTVFFGGGTPSLLSPTQLERILMAVRRRFTLDADAEISLEANPDDVTPSLVDAWSSLGINRVSLGVQSFDDAVLRYLGRRHDAASARKACACIAKHFANWGMDLIFGAPPIPAWTATLEACTELSPAHVSTYGLTYEAGTPFMQRAADAVDDSVWLDLYREGERILGESGYVHYEISNYARPGFTCRHNLIYWHNEMYAGFGAAAYGYVNGVRASNPGDWRRYTETLGIKAETLCLREAEIRTETVIQYLRLREGLSLETYARRFGRQLMMDFGPALSSLITRGLVVQEGNVIRPTQRGFEWNNEIGLALVETAGCLEGELS